VINTTNVLGKDNPRWPNGNAAETIKVPTVSTWVPRGPMPVQHGHALPHTAIWDRPAVAVGGALRAVTTAVASWLTDIPRRAGSRLFAKNDLEARWWGWQVTVLAGGLARQYRDPRFDTLRDQLGRPDGTAEPDPQQGILSGGYVPGVPEAWDDHWNGSISPGDDPRNPRIEGSAPAMPPRDGDG